MRPTDVRPVAARAYRLPIRTRMPLKFGTDVLTSVELVHVELDVEDRRGRRARGHGETPLNVQWAWPMGSGLELTYRSYPDRLGAMVDLTIALTQAWSEYDGTGHPLETGQIGRAHV